MLPITVEMMRKHLGEDATIKRRVRGWVVTTPKGEEITVRQDSIQLVLGISDTVEAMIALGEDAWGGVSVNGGSDEHTLAFMAHAELQNVWAIPIVQDPEAKQNRFKCSVYAYLLFGGVTYYFAGLYPAFFVGAVAACAFWTKMTKSEAKAERYRGQRYRNLFPSVHGGNRQTSREEAERRGYL